jgi:hypothetical protein
MRHDSATFHTRGVLSLSSLCGECHCNGTDLVYQTKLSHLALNPRESMAIHDTEPYRCEAEANSTSIAYLLHKKLQRLCCTRFRTRVFLKRFVLRATCHKRTGYCEAAGDGGTHELELEGYDLQFAQGCCGVHGRG